MKLVVNGEPHEHQGDGTLAALLAELQAHPERTSTVVNDEVIPRENRCACRLQEGDHVEILVFAGGG